jgi:hypothetical protein
MSSTAATYTGTVNGEISKPVSSFFTGVKAGRISADILRKAFNEDPTLISACDTTDGSTLLHWSSLRGDVSLVNVCIAAGCDVSH